MAKGHLDLLILNRALIIFYRTFILQHDFFLIIEGLLRYAVSSPRVPVTLQVHLRLREHVGIALQCTLSLQELCLEGSRVDFDQGLAFANELAFLVVNLGHEPRDFAGNRVGIDGSDGTNRFQINPNIAVLLSSCCRNTSTRITARTSSINAQTSSRRHKGLCELLAGGN